MKRENILVIELIIRNLAKIAKSNNIIVTTTFNTKNRKLLKKTMLTIREDFFILINMIYKLRMKISKKRIIAKKKDFAKKIKKKFIRKT